MRIVLDTNVLVSGLLRPLSPPGQITALVAAGSLSLCYDARILDEYRRVLLRERFGFDAERVAALLAQIAAAGSVVAAEPLTQRRTDPDDEPFLEVALAGGVRCLVTGNLRHFPPERCQGMVVLPPAEFLAAYRRERSAP